MASRLAILSACPGKSNRVNNGAMAAGAISSTQGARARAPVPLVLLGLGLALLGSPQLGCASSDLRAGRLGASEDGVATYYSRRLAGHLTASGERYDPSRFTAAHPEIPFGTRVRVVRADGGQRVVVRINDRCARGGKIIDLSEAAARQLDMIGVGRAPVHLRIVMPPPR
jgi:rare lipoprotein A